MPIAAPILAAGIGGAASIGSALIGSNAASSAAKAQAAAAQAGLNAQIDAGNNASQQLAPFADIGTGAAHSLADLYGIGYNPQGSATPTTSASGVITPGSFNAPQGSQGGQSVANTALANFTNTPDYQFAFQQGLQALDRSAAAQGQLQSGGVQKAAQQYGQGLASQQFGNYFNRLLSLSQLGQQAAAGSATNSLNAANSQANSQQAIGQAQASGDVGTAKALSGGLSGLGSNLQQGLLLNAGYGGAPTPQAQPSYGLSSYSAPGAGYYAPGGGSVY